MVDFIWFVRFQTTKVLQNRLGDEILRPTGPHLVQVPLVPGSGVTEEDSVNIMDNTQTIWCLNTMNLNEHDMEWYKTQQVAIEKG